MSSTGTPTSGVEAPAGTRCGRRCPPRTPSEPGLTPAPGTWSVGRFDPRVVKALTVLGFALPVVGYVALVLHYQVNAIWQDQWDDINVIRHFPQWSSLWYQHTDNRVLFPNLIVVVLAHTVHYNIDVEEYLSALMLFGTTALFIWSHKRRSPNTPLLFYCPVAFLTLTLSQWQNAVWGYQMAWYLVLLSLAVTIALLDRPQAAGPLGWPRLAWPTFVVAALVAVVDGYSSLQGLLSGQWGLVLLLPPPMATRAATTKVGHANRGQPSGPAACRPIEQRYGLPLTTAEQGPSDIPRSTFCHWLSVSVRNATGPLEDRRCLLVNRRLCDQMKSHVAPNGA